MPVTESQGISPPNFVMNRSAQNLHISEHSYGFDLLAGGEAKQDVDYAGYNEYKYRYETHENHSNTYQWKSHENQFVAITYKVEDDQCRIIVRTYDGSKTHMTTTTSPLMPLFTDTKTNFAVFGHKTNCKIWHFGYTSNETVSYRDLENMDFYFDDGDLVYPIN